MNDENETAAVTELHAELFPAKCPKCHRRFKNDHAMRVHVARTHGRGWDTTKNLQRWRKHLKGRPPQPRDAVWHERQKAQRRETQRRARERNFARGLNAKGKPYTRPDSWNSRAKGKRNLPPSSTKAYRKAEYHRRKARFRAQGLNAQGRPFKNGQGPAARLLAQAQQEPTPADNMGDSARAIIMAAQVLRAVSLGLKL